MICFKWLKNKIINIFRWNNNLFTIYLKNNIIKFIPGQFTKLALLLNNEYIYRYYSFVNLFNSKILEFYIYKINKGYFSNILYNLNIGNRIYISNISYGNFTLYNIIKKKKKYIWMICTNTGISPFICILQNNIFLLKNKFKHIYLIYGLKYINDFIYINKIYKLLNIYNNFLTFIIVLSKEKNKINLPFFLYKGRVSDIILYKIIQKIKKKKINKNNHFMLCGNINMINDLSLLLNKNFNLILNKDISIEIY